mmetsp:Transcript_9683/g.23693  ORF Transcript_9683/g.23693 Transcript_9683/m.23693 type:complete len:317 (+) Transcript_9683:1327-2277(+)
MIGNPTSCLFVFFRSEFVSLGLLLGLDSGLALVVGQLGLALEGLIGREFLLLAGGGILADLFVDGLVELLEPIAFDIVFDELGEVLLVLLVIFLLEVFHVFTDVPSEDALAVHVGVVLLGVSVVSGESLLGVGDVESTVGGALEGSEDAGSGGGGLAPDVEKGAEGALVVVDFLDVVGLLVVLGRDDFSVDLGVSLVELVESDLLEETTGAEETGAVRGGVVLQTDGEAVAVELGGLSLAEDAIAVDESVRDLADHLGVGESDDETVLWRLVLVLVLGAQPLALAVVGLTLASASELHLIPREVRLALSLLYECHG